MSILKSYISCVATCSLIAFSCSATNSRTKLMLPDFDSSLNNSSCTISTPKGDIKLTFFQDSSNDDSDTSDDGELSVITEEDSDDNDDSTDAQLALRKDSSLNIIPSSSSIYGVTKPNKFNTLCIDVGPVLSKPREVKIVLTIDGGGSRGIIPLFFINEMLRRLEIDTGRHLDHLPIDMYAGTSVGALIAVAASAGRTKEIEERYGSLVHQIFSYSWWKWPFTKFFHGYTYTSNGRAEAIKELVPEQEEQLDTSGDLVIPFCSAKTHDIFKYTNYDANKKFKLHDALMATSAAPSYFQPHIFKGLDNETYEGTDGGLFANHPGDIALDEARGRYPNAKIIMISLGTGHCNPSSNTTEKRSLLGWASHIADLCLSLQSRQTNEGLVNLSESNVHGRYFEYIRINPMIDHKDFITDGVDPQYIGKLKTIARQSISRNGSERGNFEDAISALKQHLLMRLSRRSNSMIVLTHSAPKIEDITDLSPLI